MKKLYALLVFLIILYIGINVAADNLPFTGSHSTNATDDNSSSIKGTVPHIDGFKDSKVNDTAARYKDSNNMTIYLNLLDNSRKISDIVNGLDQSAYTSNQTIDQKGVTTYFLYDEGPESYDADIYFNKNNQNYLITGDKISYEDSDYFINHCKAIIDSI